MNFLNIIVDNGNVWDGDKELIFGDEEAVRVSPNTTIFDLLIMIEAFPSKNQAKKNWKHGSTIPSGFSEFFIGKLKRHLVIWNPTKWEDEDEET